VKMKFRFAAVLLLAAAAFCAPAAAAEEKTLTIGSYMMITTLWPWKTTSDGDGYIIRQIYHTLVEMDEHSKFTPSLATKWECADDGVTWTVHLRDDVYWQRGNDLFGDEKVKVTAEDVKFSYDYYLDPSHGSVRYDALSKTLKEVRVVDDYTVQFVTNDIDVLWEYSMYQNYIIPRRAIEKNWDLGKFPVGSGAYKFKEYVTDTSVTLVKNDDFWKKPALDKIVYKFITDKSVSAMALQNKEIDIALAILPTELENIVNKDYLVLAPSAIGSLRWIGFNCKLDIFSDPKVRRALAMAVNMDGAIAAIFKNNVGAKLAVRAYGCISYERPGGDLESNKAVTPQYNPKEAMKILDELGWKRGRDGIREKDGKKLSFILQVGNNDANREKLSVIVATQLKAIGVDCTARTAEWATHTSDIAKGNVQMYILGGYGNLDGGKRLMETNPNRFSPNCGYSNPEVDKLIKEAFRTLDYDKRCDLLRRADNIFSSECPHLGGYFEYSQMAYNKRVTDFGYATVYQALCSPMRNVGVSD